VFTQGSFYYGLMHRVLISFVFLHVTLEWVFLFSLFKNIKSLQNLWFTCSLSFILLTQKTHSWRLLVTLCLSQTRTWISNVICLGLFTFNELSWGMIVRFVDIGGIVDRHCLNFLYEIYFIIVTGWRHRRI
jgi:hypothetical protein